MLNLEVQSLAHSGESHTFRRGCFLLLSVLVEASDSSSSISSDPSMKAFPLTVMGPLPCS